MSVIDLEKMIGLRFSVADHSGEKSSDFTAIPSISSADGNASRCLTNLTSSPPSSTFYLKRSLLLERALAGRAAGMGLATYAIISAIGLLSALSQYLLKTGLVGASAQAHEGTAAQIMRLLASPALLIALCLYGACFGLYLLVLAKADVSQIFPATIGVNILFVALTAVVMLGETMTLSRVSGMLFIVTGVYLVSRS